jgi:hypothetical protein
VALHALSEDEVTRRLRVYSHGTVQRIEGEEEIVAARAEEAAAAKVESQRERALPEAA